MGKVTFIPNPLCHSTQKIKTMKRTPQFILTLIFSLWVLSAHAQQLDYTVKETEIIHDSIKKSRWDIGGRLSQYTFRYMSEFFPVGMIKKSSRPFEFNLNPKNSIENISVKSKDGDLTLEEYFNKLHITGIIVVHKGDIVYENYLSMYREDQHTLQSITKVITSTLITSLINENKINIDYPIENYIQELEGSEWQGISVRDILNMKTGMDSNSIDFSTGPFTNPLHKNYQFESTLGALPKVDNTPSSVYQYLIDLKKDKDAGIAAEYSNLNTFVLGWLAEKVTGQKYVDLVAERIWNPMGATSNAYICLSEEGIPWTHGGMSATLRDLARFGMLYTKTEIKNRNEKLISLNQINEIFNAEPIDSPFAPFKWAYQWDIAMEGILMKGGFGGQALYIHPEKEIVIAYFNYIDKDWSVNNMISETVLFDIIKSTEE